MDYKQYLEDVQCSNQWRGFLAALADELASRLGAGELREVMMRIGSRMVSEWPQLECGSLEELESAVNAIWREMNWGWVEMRDSGDHIDLIHFSSPLRAVFGDAAIGWVPALLEGVYGDLFTRMGADSTLVLRPLPFEPGDGGDMKFYFGRKLG